MRSAPNYCASYALHVNLMSQNIMWSSFHLLFIHNRCGIIHCPLMVNQPNIQQQALSHKSFTRAESNSGQYSNFILVHSDRSNNVLLNVQALYKPASNCVSFGLESP